MSSSTHNYLLNPDCQFLARPEVNDVVAVAGTQLAQLRGTVAESIRLHAVNGSSISSFSEAPENALNAAEEILVRKGYLIQATSELLDFADIQSTPLMFEKGIFQFIDFIGVTELSEFMDVIDRWALDNFACFPGRFSIIITRSLTKLIVQQKCEELLKLGVNTIFLTIEADRFLVGPIFPSETITPEDLFQCVNYNERTTQLNGTELLTPLKRRTILEGLQGALQIIAGYIQKPQQSELRNSLVSTYGPNQRHHVRRAQIKSVPAPSQAVPVILEEGVNGDRTYSSKEFVERYSFLVSDVTGVVTSLTRLETADKSEPSFVFSAGHNWALRTDNPESIRRSLRGQSGGKGTTSIDAMAGAIAEAVERHSAIARGNEPVVHCRFTDLPGAIHPNDIAQFSQQQFDNRDHLNSMSSLYQYVPEPFDPSNIVSFVPIWSPSSNKTAWMLAAQAYFMFPNAAALPGALDLNGIKYARADSNGCAAGTTPADATFQGLCELIERDAVSIWWHNRIKRPEIPISSLDNAYVKKVAQWMKQHGRNLWLLDLTNDINIPVVAAVSVAETSRGTNKILLGFGSHTNISRAATRAVSEVIQFQAALPSEVIGDNLPNRLTGSEAIDWYAFQTLEANDFLLPQGQSDPSRYTEQQEYDVKQLIASVESVGSTVFLLDMTRSDIGIPVVRCVAPGLRSWWRRLAPGRLYDVPVRLGWLDVAHTEEEMNPIGMFF